MDEKLKTTIDKVLQLSKQNAEFDAELRKRLGVSSAKSLLDVHDDKVDQIYEFCINQVTYKQAVDFYKDFPIESIKDYLVFDYWRMEQFRRKNNFGDFCLAMYQQIENITNFICNDENLQEVAASLWHLPYSLKSGPGGVPSIDERMGKTIASFIFFGNDYISGKSHSEIKSKIPLNKLSAYDKMRVVLYFVGYKAMMRGYDNNAYSEFSNLLYELYQMRNTNHRGTMESEKAKEMISRITSLKSLYYSKFHGILAQYVTFVKEGYPLGTLLTDFAANNKK